MSQNNNNTKYHMYQLTKAHKQSSAPRGAGAVMAMAYAGLHARNLSAMGVAQAPDCCNIEVAGDEYIGAPREVWQTALYKVYVFEGWSVLNPGKLAAWVAAKFGRSPLPRRPGHDAFFEAVHELLEAWEFLGVLKPEARQRSTGRTVLWRPDAAFQGAKSAPNR